MIPFFGPANNPTAADGPTSAPSAGPATAARLIRHAVAEAPEGRRVDHTLRYEVGVGWDGAWEIDTPDRPDLENLEFVNLQITETVSERRRSRTFTYFLRPLAPGTARVGPLDIPCRASEGGDEQRLAVPAMEMRILPHFPRSPWPWALGATGAVGAMAMGLMTVRRRRRQPAPAVPQETENPAVAELERFRALIIDGQSDAMIALARQALLARLAHNGHAPLRGWTTLQVLDRLPEIEPSPERQARMASILETSDAVSYAGRRLTREECDTLLRHWQALFLENAPTDR